MRIIPILSLALALALAGCGGKPQPVHGFLPADKAAYAGEWISKNMYLLITPDGNVTYHRTDGGRNVSINAPIEEFEGNDFEVGVGLLKTTFHVSKPPYQENGQWKMVVDGVQLIRTPAAGTQPAPVPGPAPAPAPTPAPGGRGTQI